MDHPCAPAQDDELLKGVVSYYRLMAAWMLRLASPSAAASGGPPELPLPSPAPLEFRMLPVRNPLNPEPSVLQVGLGATQLVLCHACESCEACKAKAHIKGPFSFLIF